MRTAATEFTIGFFALARGIGIIVSRQRVRRLAIAPFLVSFLVVLIGGILGLGYLVSEGAPKIAAAVIGILGLASAYGWVHWLVLLVFVWPVSILALFYFLYLVARILAAPFFAMLAERVLIEEGVIAERNLPPGSWIAANARMLIVSLGKSLIFLVLGSLLFVLSFFPGVNLVAALGFLLIAAFDMSDYSLEAMQLGLRERLRFFSRHFSAFLGFSLSMGLVFLVPGLSFFLFPAAVVGGADVVRRLVGMKGVRGDARL